MLFRKKITRSCLYCANGAPLENGTVLCAKKGFRSDDLPCRKFKYDPCKRIPSRMKPLDFAQFEETDFSL